MQERGRKGFRIISYQGPAGYRNPFAPDVRLDLCVSQRNRIEPQGDCSKLNCSGRIQAPHTYLVPVVSFHLPMTDRADTLSTGQREQMVRLPPQK